MTHPHTQRPAMPPRLAVEEIARCSGTQFDPQRAEALGFVLTHALESEAHAAVYACKTCDHRFEWLTRGAATPECLSCHGTG